MACDYGAGVDCRVADREKLFTENVLIAIDATAAICYSKGMKPGYKNQGFTVKEEVYNKLLRHLHRQDKYFWQWLEEKMMEELGDVIVGKKEKKEV